MAAPVAGIDALASAELQLQQLFIALNEREQALAVPTAVFSTAYDLEGQTVSFAATGIPITATATAGVVTINAQPIVGLP